MITSWLVTVKQRKKYSHDKSYYYDSIKLEFENVGTAINFCDMVLKYAKDAEVSIFHTDSNIKEEEKEEEKE